MEEARTRIVCTIGPASGSVRVLVRMMQAGMDMARLNFSHGTPEEHALLMKSVRIAARKTGKTVALLQDLQGPKIRVGTLPPTGVDLYEGQTVVLNPTIAVYKKEGPIPVGYARLAHDVKAGHRVLLDDGMFELEVLRVRGRAVHCLVKNGGKLHAHKGINLPDSTISVPSFTEKDKQDLLFGIAQGVDWVCLSFVTGPAVIHAVRKLILATARRHDVRPPLIMAKIERTAALANLDEIITAADGIMVGRGDLGVEMPFEDVPIVQKEIVEKCRLASKPVIVATQMLESMRSNPRATRAEISDVANAVFDHADAVMLSAESATGKYPAASVQAMAAVLREAEHSRFDVVAEDTAVVNCLPSSIAHAIALMAKRDLIKAVAVSSSVGNMFGFLTMFRPHVPIFVAVPDVAAGRQAILRSGVTPLLLDDHAGTFVPRFHALIRQHIKVKSGDYIAYVTAVPRGGVSLSLVAV